MNEWNYHGKEKKPTETIDTIKMILSDLGFEHSCDLIEPQIETCYFSTIHAGGFSSNGKGFSAELCEASGYAELIERIQNKKLSPSLQYFDEYYTYQKSFFSSTQNICATHPVIESIFSTLVKSAIDDDIDTTQATKYVNELLVKLSNNDEYILRSFYSVKEDKEVFLPVDFLQYFTGTNGMAAGNTLNEAIVQGLCEILERYVAIQILTKGLTPPEVPRDELVQYEQVYKVIEKIEANKNYRVAIFDASLGKGIPCVICVVKNLQYQSVGVKFGAYPHMRIALERCLSEAFQGQNLESFSKSGNITFSTFARHSWQNILNILKVSHGTFPYSMFLSNPSWQYSKWNNVEELDNVQMRKTLFGVVESLGSEVFIQDVSFLGFPSVYIYVPKLSEIAPVDSLWLEEQAMERSVQRILCNKELCDLDVETLYTFARLKRNSYLENSLKHIAHIAYEGDFRNTADEMGFVAFLCAYYLDEKADAIRILNSIHRTDYINAVRIYISAEFAGLPLNEIKNLLLSLCDKNVAEQVFSDLKIRKNVLRNILPFCEGSCDACENMCTQKKVRKNYFAILEREIKANIGVTELRKIIVG